MWHQYFKVKKIRPGRVVVPGHGTLDFSKSNIPVAVCQELYEKEFPYLELTELGKEKLYGVKPQPDQPSTDSQTEKDPSPFKKSSAKKPAQKNMSK